MIKCQWPGCENDAEYYLIYEIDHSALVGEDFCYHHAELIGQKYPVYTQGAVSEESI